MKWKCKKWNIIYWGQQKILKKFESECSHFVVLYSTLSSPSCKFDKILVVGYFIEQNFIEKMLDFRNYFKNDLLNFSFH